jgi:hypothetical protein
MLYYVFPAMAIAPFFGIPLLVVLVIGAVCQCIVAYILTRDGSCVRLMVGLICVALTPAVMSAAGEQGSADLPAILSVLSSDWVVAVTAILALAMATLTGAYGTGRAVSGATGGDPRDLEWTTTSPNDTVLVSTMEAAPTRVRRANRKFGRMIVGRSSSGAVEAAGWDCAVTRKDAREWLERGLVLEFVTGDQLDALDVGDVFSTTAPIGEVLTRQQATSALAGY